MKTSLKNHFLCRLKKSITTFFIITLLLVGFIFISLPSTMANETNAEKYAPKLYFEAEEECFPIDARFHIDNSELFIHNVNSSVRVDETPTDAELALITEKNYFLDNVQGSVRDSSSIISSYLQQKNNYDITVYYKEHNQLGNTVLQYWFFYAYNKGSLNLHEGDWEMIQIMFESNIPSKVMYSQHHSGQQTTWNEIETTSSHPHVYVARGSHANYFRSFSGKLGIAGDIVGNNGEILTSDDYTLVELSDQGWLSFAGRWGEVENIEDTFLGFSGPFGPAFRENKEMWNDPVGWGQGLSSLNTSLLPIEFFLYHFVTIFLLITIVSIGLLTYKLYRRYQKQGLGPRFFSFLYIDGINQYSIGNLLFFVSIIIVLFGLVLPWYAVSAQVSVEGYTTEGFTDFLLIDGLQGVQITYPGANGPVAMGSLMLPFAVIIGIGIIFSLFKAAGVQQSKILGKVYIRRGISFILPFIILLVLIFSLGFIFPSVISENMGNNGMGAVFSSLSNNPFGGSESFLLAEDGLTGSIDMVWGFGLGGYLLLFSGFLLILSGVIEVISKKTFY